MARLAGINIPDNKHTEVSLTYIFGIGRKTARDLCELTGVEPSVNVRDLTEVELDAVGPSCYVEGNQKLSLIHISEPTRPY